MSDPTSDQILEAIRDMIRVGDMESVTALLRLLAVKDPQAAQGVVDAFGVARLLRGVR